SEVLGTRAPRGAGPPRRDAEPEAHEAGADPGERPHEGRRPVRFEGVTAPGDLVGPRRPGRRRRVVVALPKEVALVRLGRGCGRLPRRLRGVLLLPRARPAPRLLSRPDHGTTVISPTMP